MYASTTEDIQGSNEDLIPSRMSENAFGYAQLQLGAEEANTGHAPYSVVFSNSPFKLPKSRLIKILIFLLLLTTILCAIFIALFATRKCSKESIKESKGKYCFSPGCVAAADFMQTAMDVKANPCQDFYQFACGGWIKDHPIPSKMSHWGVDSVLAKRNLFNLKRMLEERLNVSQPAADATQKAARFYKACMDDKDRKLLAGKPLLDLLKKVDDEVSVGERDKASVLRKMLQIYNQNFSVNALFASFVEVDARNSSRYAIQIRQSGLGLSAARYSANTTDKVLSVYLEYMTTIHMLLGATNKNVTRSAMMTVLNFEKNLSMIFVPRESATNIDESYQKMTIAQLQIQCPMIDWLKFYQHIFADTAKITAKREVIVLSLPYMVKLAELVKKTPSKVLFLYVHWAIISRFAPFLSDDFVDAKKDLKIALYGTSLQQEKWKECVRHTDSAAGFALGALFVKEYFPPQSRNKVVSLVEELRNAFIQNLPNVQWMDYKTRAAAKGKAEAVLPKIGFPEEILDPKKLNNMYSGVDFSDKYFFSNIIRSLKFKTTYAIQLLPKKVDKKMWYMTPATVNAYYDPTRNQIVFPAGILQPPYYDARSPGSVNFGGIGAVIGHELLHGFDNDGRLYDKNGNSGKLWWTQHAVNEFKKKQECFIEEYGNFSIVNKHINGKVTLGENIADNGGLVAAYRAYKAWTKKNGEETLLPGLARSNEQVFFISFAQSWCTSARDAAVLAQLDTDTHSPPKDRVLGSVSNFDAFATAFSCPAGSTYNPRKKCTIW